MADAPSQGRSVLKYGCLGCLGLLLLAAACTAGMTGIAWFQAKNEEIVDGDLERQLPEPGAEVRPSPPETPSDITERAFEGEIGRVILELRHGEFHIEPAEAGGPLRVDSRYDQNSHELDESMGQGEDGRWEYRLSFRRTGGSFVAALRSIFSDVEPRVHVLLPRGVPMELELRVSEGGGVAELGGLWLTSADIDMEMGGMELSVSEPMPEPMDRLSVRAGMGGGEFKRLGNASPRELSVDFSMGGGDIDLRGEWVADSEIEIRTRMGGVAVRLPRDVNLVGVDGGFAGPPSGEIPLPTLRFDVSASMGEVEFR